MTPNPSVLRLDPTGQYLGGPIVGAHDNTKPVDATVRSCLAQLSLIAGH